MKGMINNMGIYAVKRNTRVIISPDTPHQDRMLSTRANNKRDYIVEHDKNELQDRLNISMLKLDVEADIHNIYAKVSDKNSPRGKNVIENVLNETLLNLIPDKEKYVKIAEVEAGSDTEALECFIRENMPMGCIGGTQDEIYLYKIENDEIILRNEEEKDIDRELVAPTLRDMQDLRMETVKNSMSQYLRDNYVVFKDGEKYPIDYESQVEMADSFTNAQIAMALATDEGNEPKIKWHTYKGPDKEMSVSDFMELSVAIQQAIAPVLAKKNEFKKKIYDCADKNTLFDFDVTINADSVNLNQPIYNK